MNDRSVHGYRNCPLQGTSLSPISRLARRGLELALMKLHHGHIASAKGPANRTEDHVRDSMKGRLMHLVEQTIHQPREVAFDEETLPDKKSHQISDGGKLTERN